MRDLTASHRRCFRAMPALGRLLLVGILCQTMPPARAVDNSPPRMEAIPGAASDKPLSPELESARQLGTAADFGALDNFWSAKKWGQVQEFVSAFARMHVKRDPAAPMPAEMERFIELELANAKERPVTEALATANIGHRSLRVLDHALAALAVAKGDANSVTNVKLVYLSFAPATGQRVNAFLSSRKFLLPTQRYERAIPAACAAKFMRAKMKGLPAGISATNLEPECAPDPRQADGPDHLRLLLNGLAPRALPELKAWWLAESQRVNPDTGLALPFMSAFLAYGDRDSALALEDLLSRSSTQDFKSREVPRQHIVDRLERLPAEKAAVFGRVYQRFLRSRHRENLRALDILTAYDEQAHRILLALSKRFADADQLRMTGRVTNSDAPNGVGSRQFKFLWKKNGDFLLTEGGPENTSAIWRADGCMSQFDGHNYRRCGDKSPPSHNALTAHSSHGGSDMRIPPIAQVVFVGGKIVADPAKAEYFLGWPPATLSMKAQLSLSGVQLTGREPGDGRATAEILMDASATNIASISATSGESRSWQFESIDIVSSISADEMKYSPGAWASLIRLKRENAILNSEFGRFVGSLLAGLASGGFLAGLLVGFGATSRGLRRMRIVFQSLCGIAICVAMFFAMLGGYGLLITIGVALPVATLFAGASLVAWWFEERQAARCADSTDSTDSKVQV